MSANDTVTLTQLHMDLLGMLASGGDDVLHLYERLEAWHWEEQEEGLELDEDGEPVDDVELAPFTTTGQQVRQALLEMELLGYVKVDMATGKWYLTDKGRQMVPAQSRASH